MIFAVDERGWDLGNLTPPGWVERLENLLDLADDLIARNHSLVFSPTVFLKEIVPGFTLYDLYADGSPIQIDWEVRNRIATLFSRAFNCEDYRHQVATVLVDAGAGIERAEALAYACSQSVLSCHMPCVTYSHSGLRDVMYGDKKVPIWFVKSTHDVQRFFRWLIVVKADSPAGFSELTHEAFRDLAFVEGAVDGMKNMAGDYRSLVEKIVADLGFLSDYGREIFAGPWQEAPSRFGAGGVNISDENGNTKKNSVAKSRRKITYKGKERYFWWHIKLQPHQNRIHILPDDVPKDPIAVGIFCKHLI